MAQGLNDDLTINHKTSLIISNVFKSSIMLIVMYSYDKRLTNDMRLGPLRYFLELPIHRTLQPFDTLQHNSKLVAQTV